MLSSKIGYICLALGSLGGGVGIFTVMFKIRNIIVQRVLRIIASFAFSITIAFMCIYRFNIGFSIDTSNYATIGGFALIVVAVTIVLYVFLGVMYKVITFKVGYQSTSRGRDKKQILLKAETIKDAVSGKYTKIIPEGKKKWITRFGGGEYVPVFAEEKGYLSAVEVQCSLCGGVCLEGDAHCPMCGKGVLDSVYYCPICNTPYIEETPYCENCGKDLNEN